MGNTSDIKQEILGIPKGLRDTLDKGCGEYEALIRQIHWGDGPIYVLAGAESWPSALTAVYAFESMLGWPVVPRQGALFQNYTLPALRPRSIVLAISTPADSEEMVQAAQAAKARGGVVLAVSEDPEGPVAKLAEGVFRVRVAEDRGLGLGASVSRQAALGAIALRAARIFKRLDKHADLVYEEFENLPQSVEWIITHLTDAAQSFATALRALRRLLVVGGGYYHPAALQAALVLTRLAGVEAEGVEASAFLEPSRERLESEAGVLFLSGVRCRLRKAVHQAAKRVSDTGRKAFSITDRDDGELARHSSMALLLPAMSEVVGSTLALAAFEWVAYWAAVDLERGGEKRVVPERVRRKNTGG